MTRASAATPIPTPWGFMASDLQTLTEAAQTLHGDWWVDAGTADDGETWGYLNTGDWGGDDMKFSIGRDAGGYIVSDWRLNRSLGRGGDSEDFGPFPELKDAVAWLGETLGVRRVPAASAG